VITAGEPAGIGPDLCIQIAQFQLPCELIVIADPDLLSERANLLNLSITLNQVDLTKAPTQNELAEIKYISVSLAAQCHPGVLNTANAKYVLDSLQIALEGCMNGQFDAVVTAPVHKGVINDANVPFTGHTEFFADGAGVDNVVMMLATNELKVALATTHLPLKMIAEAITKPLLEDIIRKIDASFKLFFNKQKPRIAVCGLNPHAGENGHLGTEEITVIQPVIETCIESGIDASGPWPADTIFVDEHLKEFDVVLAMYHDQGLPVLKHHGFGRAVNVTLGLPFIRTSVDHGTALELAGTGKAKETSLLAAIEMAMLMTKTR
jgi:4-hydroxythreonine-4-phosphate dehydrogenase